MKIDAILVCLSNMDKRVEQLRKKGPKKSYDKAVMLRNALKKASVAEAMSGYVAEVKFGQTNNGIGFVDIINKEGKSRRYLGTSSKKKKKKNKKKDYKLF